MSRKVLIIDDEPDIREVAQLSLEMARGWDVSVAASGAEGLRLATQHPPDGILLDVMMPEMDGPAVLSHLLDDPRTSSIPVVFLTAKVQGADQRRFAEMRVAGILAKPFDPLTLADEMASLLGWDD
jgi:CheY-like chemotaxis protein